MFNNLSQPTGWPDYFVLEFQMTNDFDQSERTCTLDMEYNGVKSNDTYYYELSAHMFYFSKEIMARSANTSIYPYEFLDFDPALLPSFSLLYNSEINEMFLEQLRVIKVTSDGQIRRSYAYCGLKTNGTPQWFLQNEAWTAVVKSLC